MKYKIHVNGTIQDEKTGFECGLDIAVTNGGSVENIGKALQGIVPSRLRVFHLEHYGKGAAAATGLAVIVEYRLQVSQLVQIFLCVAYGCYIF